MNWGAQQGLGVVASRWLGGGKAKAQGRGMAKYARTYTRRYTYTKKGQKNYELKKKDITKGGWGSGKKERKEKKKIEKKGGGKNKGEGEQNEERGVGMGLGG